ncbi:unnamed protein product [Meganyctiphanes norvegica]|uniref:MBD domain-containing protein n=1 Tax=Meganyctiphanes norvegica TaxID=48144 RepID=A0AAV2PUP0_MEGNR
MHSAYNNVNISTEDGNFSTKTFVEDSESISCHSDPLQNYMSLTNTSQGLPPHKRSHEHNTSTIEVEIDNTGIYIPPGWNRKVYMRTTICKGQLRYDCYYYTESGKQIRSKKDAYKYANKKHLLDVDIEKLNFTVSQTTMKPDRPTLIVYLDNTGIYIPEGWQRKIYHNGQKTYHVKYINAEGRRFACKSDVAYAYKSNVDSIKENQIDVEEMDFSRGIKSQLSLNSHMKHRNSLGKIEIKVDNTGKYIPIGWQRKAYKFTQGGLKGRHTVRYITPLGKNLCSKKLVSEYIEKLESNGIMQHIDVDKMDFSWKSQMKHKNTLGKIEIQVDNTGKYIPEGWQRKVYKFTRGVHKGKHRVRYISPLGRGLCSKKLVSEYIEKIESNVFMEPIDVDKMDFSWISHMKPKNKLGKIEIDVDNTGKYIPEGWQRKAYKFTKGSKGNPKGTVVVRYISPLGKTLCSKTQVSEYIERFESNDMELINVDKMDFSSKSKREYPERNQKKRGVKKVKMDKTETYVINIR